MSFTIEWFGFMQSDTGGPRIFSINTFPDSKIAVSIENGFFRLWINLGIRFQEPISGIFNKWVHFAIVKDVQNVKIYKNGVQLGNSFEYYNGMVTDWDDVLRVGSDGDDESYFTGKLSAFRWSSVPLYNQNFNPLLQDYSSTQDTLLLLGWDQMNGSVKDFSSYSRTITNQGVSYHTDSPLLSVDGSLFFSGNLTELIIEDTDDFDFSPILLSDITTTTTTTTTTSTTTIQLTTTTTAYVEPSSTTTTIPLTTTTTTSTTTILTIPSVPQYSDRVDELYKKIRKIALSGDDYYYLWKDLVKDKLILGEMKILQDVVRRYYKIDYENYLSIDIFIKEAWKKIKFLTPPSEAEIYKNLFDEKGVYAVGIEYYTTQTDIYIGRIEQFSQGGIEIVRAVATSSLWEYDSGTSSVFEKWDSAIDFLKGGI